MWRSRVVATHHGASMSNDASQRPPSQYADPDVDGMPDVLTLQRWDYGAGEGPGSEGYGFTHPNGKPWPARRCNSRTYKHLGVLVVPVVGLPYQQDGARRIDFDPGREVRLVPEPENEHDPNAIAVRSLDLAHRAGYVKASSTKRVRATLRNDPLHVMVLSSHRNGNERTSLKLVLWQDGRLIGAEHIGTHPPVET